MKQTQTKMFDFADTGLNFTAGSKALMQDRFKKMLATGFNPQTVSSLSIAGNQVTLIYAIDHGYVADRVLQVVAVGGFNQEVYIDSVTSNTLTFTADVTDGLSGDVATKSAPLGWDLVVETGYVQLYKMRYLDERDLYVRLVFAANDNKKNVVTVCTGKTANELSGDITDDNSHTPFKTNSTITNGFGWLFDHSTSSASNNYTYSDGYSTYGRAILIGSKYHLVLMLNSSSTKYQGKIYAILPTKLLNYPELDYPLVFGKYNSRPLTDGGYWDEIYQISQVTGSNSHAMVGKTPVAFIGGNQDGSFDTQIRSISSFLPTALDPFNTSSASVINIFEKTTRQYLGMACGGLYQLSYLYNAAPPNTKLLSPALTIDPDLGSLCYTHGIFYNEYDSNVSYMVAPVEEIKIVS